MNRITSTGLAALVSACEVFSIGIPARETPDMFGDYSLIAPYLTGEETPTQAKEQPLLYSWGTLYREQKRPEDERLLQDLRRV